MDITNLLNPNNWLAIILSATFLSWIVFGTVIGILIHFIDPKEVRGGIVGTIISAVIGAVSGGILASVIFGMTFTGFTIPTFLVALAGAVALAVIERTILHNREHIKTKITRIQ